MLTRRESITDDYTKRGLSHEVKRLVNKRMTWIVLLIAMMSVIYFVFALFIYTKVDSAVQDTFETNKIKRASVLREDSLNLVVALRALETDSLKRLKTDSLMRKYDKKNEEYERDRRAYFNRTHK